MNGSRSLLLLLALICLAAGAEAQKNKPGSKGASNGKPFQYLQEQIDANTAGLDALAADHGAAIEAIQNEITGLEEQAAPSAPTPSSIAASALMALPRMRKVRWRLLRNCWKPWPEACRDAPGPVET